MILAPVSESFGLAREDSATRFTEVVCLVPRPGLCCSDEPSCHAAKLALLVVVPKNLIPYETPLETVVLNVISGSRSSDKFTLR